MTKQSGTKCSHCRNKGHNSRTCSEKVGLKLFGVTILKHKANESMKKSFSMGNLTSNNAAESSIDRGYLSDGLVRLKGDGNERKKGIPWTEEEHRTFLAGLEKLGKGNWRGISKNFVTTRTPTQVASHAQKYFMRRAISNKNKRRSSLFDMAIKDSSPISKTESSESVKQSYGVLEQVSSSAQIANQIADRAIEAPQATPMATTGAYPYFRGFPYLEGSSDGKLSYLEAKVYPTLSFVPMLNLPNRSYVYHPKPYDNFTNNTPIAPHSSVIASPQTALDCASKTEPPNSSTVNTELELGIAPSQVHDQTKLSNSVGAISVI